MEPRTRYRILDHAAGLFARHGFRRTSLGVVAGAAGISKPGLLHHFGSKEMLYRAAMDESREQGNALLGRVMRAPAGSARARRAVELTIDFLLNRPGLAHLALTSAGSGPGIREPGCVPALVYELFGVAPHRGDTERSVRVIGTVSVLTALCLSARTRDDGSDWRESVIAVGLDTLGWTDGSFREHSARPFSLRR
ncbi:TetR/AcrR family transcriptional regulator [Actinosynnema sp. NPDC051121]